MKSLLALSVKWLRNFFAIFQKNYQVAIYGSLKKFYLRDE